MCHAGINVAMKEQVIGFHTIKGIKDARCVKGISKQKNLDVIAVVLCYVIEFNLVRVGREELLWRLDIRYE